MPAPRFRHEKKRMRASPSGKAVSKYKTKKPAKATCSICSKKLNAVPNRTPNEMGKLAKTEKRPQRAFGGILCNSCTQQIYKEKTRINAGTLSKSEVDFKHLKYLEQVKA